MSGDARRALEICRRAAEFADYRIKQSQQSGQTKSFANRGTIHICIATVITYSLKGFALDLFYPYAYIQLDY